MSEEWEDFDPYKPIPASARSPILLRADTHSPDRCFGIEHFIRMVHKAWPEARQIPAPPQSTNFIESDDEYEDDDEE